MPKLIQLLVAAALLLAPTARAHAARGFVITEEDKGPGGPEKKITYVTESALRIEEGDKISLLTLSGTTLKLYEISPKERVVKDNSPMAPLLLMGYMFFLEKDDHGGARVNKKFFTPTDEKRMFGSWKARKLLVTVMGMQSEVWYTKDSKDLLDADRMRMRFFARANEVFMMPHMQTAEQKAAIRKLGKLVNEFTERAIKDYGSQVLSEVRMGGTSATTQVVAVARADHPDALFALPAGYKVEGPDGAR